MVRVGVFGSTIIRIAFKLNVGWFSVKSGKVRSVKTHFFYTEKRLHEYQCSLLLSFTVHLSSNVCFSIEVYVTMSLFALIIYSKIVFKFAL